MISPKDYISDFSFGQIDEKYRGAAGIVKQSVKDSGNMVIHPQPGLTGRQGFKKTTPATLTGNDEETRIEPIRIEANAADYIALFASGSLYLYDEDGTFIDNVALGLSNSVWNYQFVLSRNWMVIVDGENEPVVVDLNTPATLSKSNYANYLWWAPEAPSYSFDDANADIYFAAEYQSGTGTGVWSFANGTDGGTQFMKFFTDAQGVGEDGTMYVGIYNTARTGLVFGQVIVITSDSVQLNGVSSSGSFVLSDSCWCTVYVPFPDLTGDWENGGDLSFTSFAPKTVEIHEGRLIFSNDAGSTTGDEDFWMSGAGRPCDFAVTILEDSPIILNPNKRYGPIEWVYSHTRLYFGTDTGIYQFGQASGLTNYTIQTPLAQSAYGTTNIRPVGFGNAMLFSQINKKGIRSSFYRYDSEDYATTLISRARSEIFKDTQIRQITLVGEPVNMALVVTEDNKAWALMYDSEEQFNCWCNFYADGDLISLAPMKIAGGTRIFGFFRRTINGSVVDRLEYMDLTTEMVTTYDDARMLDSWSEWTGSSKAITNVSQATEAVITITDGGATFANGDLIKITMSAGMVELDGNVYQLSDESGDTFKLNNPEGTMKIDSSGFSAYTTGGTADEVVKTITGLSYLEGETINVVYPGSIDLDKTVSSGEVTISEYTNSYYLGLPYTMYVKPFVTPIMFGFRKAIITCLVNMYYSMGFKAGATIAGARDVSMHAMYDPLPDFTTDTRFVEVGIESNRAYDPDLYLVQDKPYPFTPLGILVEAE